MIIPFNRIVTAKTPKLRIARSCDVSVVVPTLNEADNLPELIARIDTALAGRTYEVIVVDDNSRDATASVCEKLATQYPLRLIVRELPLGGLAGAVLRGLKSARGDALVVMDADLQHPPEKIPALLAELRTCDFALGSRYVAGGSTERNWGRWRKVNSTLATLLAKPFAGTVRDPMSGFFGMRAETFDRAAKLNPVGYKIALELMCKCAVKDVREVPISFGVRAAGESKLTWRQRAMFLRHLGRLYAFKFPKSSTVMKWAAAGGAGAAFALLTVPAWAPLMGAWAAAAVAYATRKDRPAAVTFGPRAADREIELRRETVAVELAA